MTAYGFNEKSVAEKLKMLANQLELSPPEGPISPTSKPLEAHHHGSLDGAVNRFIMIRGQPSNTVSDSDVIFQLINIEALGQHSLTPPEYTYVLNDGNDHSTSDTIYAIFDLRLGDSPTDGQTVLWRILSITAEQDMFIFKTTQKINHGSSGTAVLRDNSGGTLSDGGSITLHNSIAEHSLWNGSQGLCQKRSDGTYIAVAHNSASVIIGIAGGNSNNGNSYAPISITSPTGFDGFFSGTISSASNAIPLEIDSGDTVVVVGDQGTDTWAIIGAPIDTGGGGTSYTAGCGLTLSGTEFSVNPNDLFEGPSFGIQPSPSSGSGCGAEVVAACGLKVEPGVGVMIDNEEVASQSIGLDPHDECGFAVDNKIVYNYFEQNIELFLNLIVQKLLETYGTTVTVLKECQGIAVDSSQLTITYTTTELTVLAVGSEGTDDSCVFDVTASCGTGA